jgi:hypothetical protein
MFSLREGELVCRERLSVEFPGRYIGSFQSTLVSVGIIIPIVNDSASYRGICKHKGRLKISADRNLVGGSNGSSDIKNVLRETWRVGSLPSCAQKFKRDIDVRMHKATKRK